MSRLMLIHQDGPRKGKSVHFEEGIVRVGREECNQLVFSDAEHLMVSRRHAEILCEAGAWILTDLGSTTGTSINNREVKKAKLADGDVIRFGEEGPEVLVRVSGEEIGSTMVITEENRVAMRNDAFPAADGMKETAVFRSSEMERIQAAAPSSYLSSKQESSFTGPSAPQPISIPAGHPVITSNPLIPPPAGMPFEKGMSRENRLLGDSFGKRIAAVTFLLVALLCVYSLYLSSQVSKLNSQMRSQAEKVNQLEEATGQLIQKLNNLHVNPVDMEKMFQKKSEELDRRMERKSREFDQKINMLLESNPLAKLRWERMQKKGSR